MTVGDVRGNIESTLETVRDFESLAAFRAGSVLASGNELVTAFQNDIDLRIGVQETELSRLASQLTLNAHWHINRAYFQASPGLIAIIAGIVKVVSTVVAIIKAITNSVLFRVILTIHKLMYATWGEYRTAVNKVLRTVGNFASDLGMTFAGFAHILHAGMSGFAGFYKMLGKGPIDWEATKLFTMEEYCKRVAVSAKDWAKDPMAQLEMAFFDSEDFKNAAMGVFGDRINFLIDNVSTGLTEVGKTIQTVTSDFNEFLESLPSFIRDNIPQAVWDGIYGINNFIDKNLLPAIQDIRQQIDEINHTLISNRQMAKELTDRMNHPGDMLLGVDDLPVYARDQQLKGIDDVTSRQLAKDAGSESVIVDDEMKPLSEIVEAMSVPTAAPEFLTIESPERAALTGIIIEPHETWFVGDY